MLVNIHYVKTNLIKLINQTLEGEEIIVVLDGKPIIKLTPCAALPDRQGEQLKGIIQIADDFDAPLPREYLDQFYNNGGL